MKNTLFGIVILLILAGSGYYTYMTQTQKTSLEPEKVSLPSSTPAVDETEQIKAALVTKNSWENGDQLRLTIKTIDEKYASGQVTAQGGGGYFYAIKENGEWKIVADGNGIISCDSLIAYPDYPTTLISSCYDETTQNVVKR